MFTVAVRHFYKMSTSYTEIGEQSPTGKVLKSGWALRDRHALFLDLLVVMLPPC